MIAVMTLKPGYVGCLVIVAATIALGWVIGMRAARARPGDTTQSDRSVAA